MATKLHETTVLREVTLLLLHSFPVQNQYIKAALERILFSSVVNVLVFHASTDEGFSARIDLCFSYALVANFHFRRTWMKHKTSNP